MKHTIRHINNKASAGKNFLSMTVSKKYFIDETWRGCNNIRCFQTRIKFQFHFCSILKVGLSFNAKKKQRGELFSGTWVCLTVTQWKLLTAERIWAHVPSLISLLMITKEWEGTYCVFVYLSILLVVSNYIDLINILDTFV